MEQFRESDFIFYRGEDGNIHAQVILGAETVWVSQKTMAEIFGVSTPTINYHLGEIFKSQELDENSVIRKIRITASDNKPYLTQFYNLEAVIAVGYRVNSYKATKFRQWSNRITNEYLIKGFVLDDERLKQGNKLFGKDYFQELLERVQAIRASEKMFYEKIKDLYATSVDYDSSDPDTHKFFAKVQNKVEYAIVKRTSAETIRLKANAMLPNMGLQTWKNSKRDGNILKIDVTVAKNYFTQEEIKQLDALVNMYLDYAKLQVQRNKLMKMKDWEQKLDAFLAFNEFPILKDFGKIKKQVADKFAEDQFEKFKRIKEKDQLRKTNFLSIADDITSTGHIPTEQEFYDSIAKQEPLSDFNNKLKKALNFNPDSKKSKSKGTKICPNCGMENDKDADYCMGSVEIDGEIKPCGHSFEVHFGKK